jgi:nucleotide-binding universal stress UspA family protein
MIAQVLEAAMLICFGLSWPLNAYKNYQARTAAGTSWQFILLITLGYVAGIAAKYVSGQTNWVLIVYYLNLVFLAVNWGVYFRNVKLDKARLASARDGAAEASRDVAPTRILVASDGSEASLDAIRFSMKALDFSHADVKVVCAVEVDKPKAREFGEEKLRKAEDILNDAGVSYRPEVLFGPASTQIVKAAHDEDAELVVMGCRGLSGLKSRALGSVSRTVAEYCEKPVLIVK